MDRLIFDRFLSEKSKKYILGINNYSTCVANHIDIDGFVDDFTAKKEYLGKPILRLPEVPKDGIVMNASTLRPLTVKRKLDTLGLTNIDYFGFQKYAGSEFETISCWDAFQEDLRNNKNKYDWIFSKLSDHKSRETFNKLVAFRSTQQLVHMKGFEYNPEGQYFDSIVKLSPGSSFLDVGGFRGETSIEFAKRCPYYKSIHIFEPDADNYKLAMASTSNLENITLHNIGLSNKKGELSFDGRATSYSKVSESGVSKIRVDCLDNLAIDHVSYLKMDIEGSEHDAIEGASETIRRFLPDLAIAVYHKGTDFWSIPEQVDRLHDKYSIYLRHYTEGVDETVMYFLNQ